MESSRPPVLFVGHGHPLNALRHNAFTRFLEGWAGELEPPRAILAVSAHWERSALAVSTAARPETIHDFYGFPEELYELSYPAPGAPDVARLARALCASAGLHVQEDSERGLDHGVWVPLRRLYPDARCPVAQLSLWRGDPLERHAALGRALAPLREEGVLILASGNLVHNLRSVDFENEQALVPAWARAFDAWVAERLAAWDVGSLAAFRDRAADSRLAHPTTEHYAPLLVACGAAGERPRVSFPFTGFEHATISMRCVRLD